MKLILTKAFKDITASKANVVLGMFIRWFVLPPADPQSSEYTFRTGLLEVANGDYQDFDSYFMHPSSGLFSTTLGYNYFNCSRLYPVPTLFIDRILSLSIKPLDSEAKSTRYTSDAVNDSNWTGTGWDKLRTSLGFAFLYAFNLTQTPLTEIKEYINDTSKLASIDLGYVAGALFSDSYGVEMVSYTQNQIDIPFDSGALDHAGGTPCIFDTNVFDTSLYTIESIRQLNLKEGLSAAHYSRSFIANTSYLNASGNELISKASGDELGRDLCSDTRVDKRDGVSMDISGCWSA